ncbi:MAG: carbamoyltransferase HypF [Candidatus Cloacimonetes bacterium]|nr:carbamoyltransferase HypF [Candidatus Cloacimonadota bacterium]
MLRIKINGIVQGVGFRPFVYKTAIELGLKGYVLNSTSGVEIEACCMEKNLELFIERIKKEHPPAAFIREFHIEEKEDVLYSEFTIRQSRNRKGSTQISPDLAVCEDCTKELFDESDPRFNYAFINCTNCGPRYSIIENTPYDRPVTSMKNFKMCDYCNGEYTDPLNRRFHAQPIACPACGPRLKFLTKNFEEVEGDPISNTIKFLKEGKIIGIKGIGGFHIACDATNFKTISELRKRKDRPHKPFAVMCYLEKMSEVVEINEEQYELLKSPAAPIVILPKSEHPPVSIRQLPENLVPKSQLGNTNHSHPSVAGWERERIDDLERDESRIIAANVAPQNPNLGVFLPYAPIHYQILSEELPYLIMTSGNFHDDPIAAEEKELSGLCDFFLTHNRPILNRSDDSVIRASKPQNVMMRRSRGYVPSPIKLPFKTVQTLGAGAELKITFALSKDDSFFLSPYIGNSGSKQTLDFYTDTLEKYKKWFELEPELVICDLHPDYMTTRFAESTGLPLKKVQHHHAHIAAVMAEHHLDEPVIGIAYDGTGYGTDEAIWGGEIFLTDYAKFERLFHLNYMPLPGGDAAIKHPIRIAYAYLLASGIDPDFLENISEIEKRIISKQIENKFNIFRTSSMGRLFDCVAAMLGLFPEITFEAQSAMALEFLSADKNISGKDNYPYNLEKDMIDIIPLIRAVANDVQRKKPLHRIADKFHSTIINFTLEAVKKAHRKTGIRKVVLSGGVMQNKVLLEGIGKVLTKNNFTVFVPSILPPNDGSISVGQVVVGNKKLNIEN